MLNPHSHSLLEHIAGSYDQETVDSVSDLFNQLGLVPPERREYYVSKHRHYRVYLDDLGSTLSLVKSTVPAIHHPHVLQPIGTLPAGALRAAWEPGVLCPVYDDRLVRQLRQDMHDEGQIEFSDPHNYNVGFLPGLPTTKDNLVIIGDSDAVRPVASPADEKSEDLARAPQTKLYAPLYAAFGEAFLSGSPRPGDVTAFHTLCRASVARGTLAAAWREMDGGAKAEYKVITGRNYAKHLATAPFQALQVA